MKVDVKTLENKKVGDIDLSDDIFGLEPRADVLHRMVNWQLAKRRCGNHKTKDISEVSGTGKKPFAQKGGGRARKGSLRVNAHRGGGVTFGPVVRTHNIDMPKSYRKFALKIALSSKLADGKLVILDEAKSKTGKTKDMVKILSGLGFKSAIFVDEEFEENFIRSIRNIPNMEMLPEKGINVYDILHRDVLVLTKGALAKLEAKLK